MVDRSSYVRHKNAVRVRLTLTGEAPIEAAVFLKIEERLIDLLNDQRAFIPVRREDGTTMIVAKSNIVSVIEAPIEAPPAETKASGKESPEKNKPGAEAGADSSARPGGEDGAKKPEAGERARPRRIFDPYEILRVDRTASNEEIKRAYKARIKAVHPDAIAALDLDEDLARAAVLSTQKVNQAYDRIMRERAKIEELKAQAQGQAQTAEQPEKTEADA